MKRSGVVAIIFMSLLAGILLQSCASPGNTHYGVDVHYRQGWGYGHNKRYNHRGYYHHRPAIRHHGRTGHRRPHRR